MTSDACSSVSRVPAFQRTLSLLLCLASGGCGAADAPAGLRPDAPRPLAAPSPPVETVDVSKPALAHAEGEVAQFDLECATVARDVSEHRGGPGQEPHARPYTVNFRYLVDLGARKYCDADWCWVRGVWRIHVVDPNTITFLNVREPAFVSVQTVDRRNGRFIHRSLVNGLQWLREGTCRQEPFSGFPDTSDSPDQDPWQ